MRRFVLASTIAILLAGSLFGNRIELYILGERVAMDRFFQLGNTVFVHAVTLAEALEAEYEWDNTEKSLIIRLLGKEMIFFNQSDRVWVNDRYVTLQASPRLVQNRFFIPVKDFGELTGLSFVVAGERVDVATVDPSLSAHHNVPENQIEPVSVEVDDETLDFWEPGLRPNPLIVIDPGHGGVDTGAIGPTRTTEKELVLTISSILSDLLQEQGYEVVMTRETDVFVGLQQRAVIANQKQADLFVSIHLNSFTNPQVRGAEVYFYDYSESAYLDRLVRLHQDSLPTEPHRIQAMIDHKQQVMFYSEVAAKEMLRAFEKAQYMLRGLRRDDFAVVAYTTVPSILVECDFMSNPQVEALLKTRQYQEKLAKIILHGIENYFRFLENLLNESPGS